MAKPRFRARFKQHRLRARYVCPKCGRVAYYPCYLDGPGERVRGRPIEDYCTCGALTEYWGFTSRYKGTVPYAWGGRWMRDCKDCKKSTEHARMEEGGKLCRCMECGQQRRLDDEEEKRREKSQDLTATDIWGLG